MQPRDSVTLLGDGSVKHGPGGGAGMKQSLGLALLSIFFAGLLALAFKTQSIKLGPIQVHRAEFPELYWLGVGVHVFIMGMLIAGAVATAL